MDPSALVTFDNSQAATNPLHSKLSEEINSAQVFQKYLGTERHGAHLEQGLTLRSL